MSKGHTIPLLHLARLLLNRRLAVTIFTTQSNRRFIADSLSDTSAAIIDLPFQETIAGIPAGIESTDMLPSMSLFFSFAETTELIQPHFERALETLLPPVSFIVSDAFLWWTQESASKFGIPRLEYFPKAWCIGPLCLTDEKSKGQKLPWPVQRLDQKLEEEKSVLYIAFGGEFFVGVEEQRGGATSGFGERVKDRGIIVKDWVDQREILEHESVEGFLSHCGWNSVMEGVCASVPILAWLMMAEQYLNARMVAEEIKVGLRVETCDGSVRGFVKWDGLKKMVKELMEGNLGKEVRKKVKEVAEMAKKAMEEGTGSSWRTFR
ncbi:hypothetical protein UlMin_014974 [Ulmus minor]